ncbi:hypothetical protein [Akkermansia massiliensis]
MPWNRASPEASTTTLLPCRASSRASRACSLAFLPMGMSRALKEGQASSRADEA